MGAVADWVERHARPRAPTFVGSSLGGFYATHLAERFGARAAMINPAVRPYDDLAPWRGVADEPVHGRGVRGRRRRTSTSSRARRGAHHASRALLPARRNGRRGARLSRGRRVLRRRVAVRARRRRSHVHRLRSADPGDPALRGRHMDAHVRRRGRRRRPRRRGDRVRPARSRPAPRACSTKATSRIARRAATSASSGCRARARHARVRRVDAALGARVAAACRATPRDDRHRRRVAPAGRAARVPVARSSSSCANASWSRSPASALRSRCSTAPGSSRGSDPSGPTSPAARGARWTAIAIRCGCCARCTRPSRRRAARA